MLPNMISRDAVLIRSDITLKTDDSMPLHMLGAIPLVFTMVGRKTNTVTQLLHIVLELSVLFISKNCLKNLNILSNSLACWRHNSSMRVPDKVKSTRSP
jgi:hypothetical protein